METTLKVYITKGLPASGKTTWSRNWVKKHPDYKRINRDDLRMMIYENAWNQKKEEAVLLARKTMIEAFLSAGYNLVLDDTNLDPRRMEETLRILTNWEKTHLPIVKVKVIDFTDVPLETCLERNAQRPELTRVPSNFILQYYNKYIKKGPYWKTHK